jgi:hypothetical protein
MCQVAIKDNFCGTLFEKYGFLKNIFDLQKDVLILCFLSLFKSKCRWKQNVLPEINYLNDPTFFCLKCRTRCERQEVELHETRGHCKALRTEILELTKKADSISDEKNSYRLFN